MGAAVTACGAARDARAQQGPAIQARSEPACASRHVSGCAGAYDATRLNPRARLMTWRQSRPPVLGLYASGAVRNTARPRCRLQIPRRERRGTMVRVGPYEVQVCVAGVPLPEHMAASGAVYVETVRLAHAAPRARLRLRRYQGPTGREGPADAARGC